MLQNKTTSLRRIQICSKGERVEYMYYSDNKIKTAKYNM